MPFAGNDWLYFFALLFGYLTSFSHGRSQIMKYAYRFTDETSTTIEVSEEFLKELRKLDAQEYNSQRKEEYHCTSLDTQNDYSRWLEEANDELSFLESMKMKLPKALEQLKPAQRNIIQLYYFKRLSQNEISKILGISQGAVSQRLAVAEKNLKKFLQKT
jgi:RNA polymerase sigma factor (sigma-70 family)